MPATTRRALLRGVATGLVPLGVGYTGSVAAARSGRVVFRHVAGHRIDDDGTRRIVDLYHAERDPDGAVDRRIHPEYRGRFDDPATVTQALRDDLYERFSTVRYYLGHRCSGCSAPAVSRRAFNAARIGESIRLLYLGDRATPVPTP